MTCSPHNIKAVSSPENLMEFVEGYVKINNDLLIKQGEDVNKYITPSSKFGNKIGFTSDKFDGYLTKDGNRIWISFIMSLQEGKGNLKNLFDNIEKQGFDIIVPTAFPRMKKICLKREMVEFPIECKIFDEIEYVNCMIKISKVRQLYK